MGISVNTEVFQRINSGQIVLSLMISKTISEYISTMSTHSLVSQSKMIQHFLQSNLVMNLVTSAKTAIQQPFLQKNVIQFIFLL